MTPTPDPLPTEAVPGLAEYSAAEQRRRFRLPAGFADRVTTGALRQRRQRVLARWTAGLTLAASVLVAVGLFATGVLTGRQPEVSIAPDRPTIPLSPAAVTPPPRVADQLAEAGAALESLTRETTEKAVAPTRALFDTATRPPEPAPEPPAPPVLELASLTSAARTSLDPVTNTTRRAMTRLLKDVGLRAN
jgi:hypothetical protein